MKLNMEDRHYNIVMNILAKYPYSIYAFGSRVKGGGRKFSDLDLIVKENIPDNIMMRMEEDFEESDLPFNVDILKLNKISPSFYQAIKAHLLQLKP